MLVQKMNCNVILSPLTLIGPYFCPNNFSRLFLYTHSKLKLVAKNQENSMMGTTKHRADFIRRRLEERKSSKYLKVFLRMRSTLPISTFLRPKSTSVQHHPPNPFPNFAGKILLLLRLAKYKIEGNIILTNSLSKRRGQFHHSPVFTPYNSNDLVFRYYLLGLRVYAWKEFLKKRLLFESKWKLKV